MNTLLHICCAPCANQCIEVLKSENIEVTGFWYNPNIHPFTEYRARRNCLRDYAQEIGLPLIEKNDYALRPFVREVFKAGQAFAREHEFYMQKYCGCVFSEEERYLKKNKIIP